MYINNLNDSEVLRNIDSEIKRYDIINYLIDKYNLINYLEIGVFNGENIRKIHALHKDGVDPGIEGIIITEVNFPMTSDNFFDLIKGHDDIKYDIIFIDGLHHSEQVKNDIENSILHIKNGGFIILHDCNPVSYEAQIVPRKTVAWNGDVWKAYVSFKKFNPDVKCCVIDTDFGVGVIQITNKQIINKNYLINWEEFNSNKKELLNLISWNDFKATY